MDWALTFPAKLIYLVELPAVSPWNGRITLYIHGKLPMYKYVLSPQLISNFFFFPWNLEHMFQQKRCYKGICFPDVLTKVHLAYDITEILYVSYENYNGTNYPCKQEHINIQQIFLSPSLWGLGQRKGNSILPYSCSLVKKKSSTALVWKGPSQVRWMHALQDPSQCFLNFPIRQLLMTEEIEQVVGKG